MLKNVSYHNIPSEGRKDIRDAWIKTIDRPFIYVCSVHLTENSFDETQKQLAGGIL